LRRKATAGLRKTAKGPSEPRAADQKARENHGKSCGGVGRYGHTKEELCKRAADLDVRRRSAMTKEQFAAAVARKQG
jgi:hypothetical protein